MKIDLIKTIIAIGVSILIAYGFYSFHHSVNSQLLVASSFVELSLSGFFVLGLRFEKPRTTANIRLVSSIFFFIFLVVNIAFSFFDFSKQSYIITNGLILLTCILIVYSIFKAKQ